MATRRRRSTRTVYARPRARSRTRYAPVRRRRSTSRRRAAPKQRTLRIVVQTVQASPLTVSGAMTKGRQVARAMF